MSPDKRTTLHDAVARLVRDGDRVGAACGNEARIPFAAGHEIVRQGRTDLTLVGPISDALYDQLIGAGCVAAVEVAWIGNVGTGLAHNYRRAVERGEPRSLHVTDYSNLTMALGIRAAAEGVPFAVTQSIAGTGMADQAAAFRRVRDPFDGEEITAVRAIPLDVALIHVQRADRFGNASVVGNLGITLESARAAKRVLVTAETIVERDELARDPNLVNVPGFLVDAVVHVPFGAHPSPVPFWYARDDAFFDEYGTTSRTAEGFAAWRARWIDEVGEPEDYLARLPAGRRAALEANA